MKCVTWLSALLICSACGKHSYTGPDGAGADGAATSSSVAPDTSPSPGASPGPSDTQSSAPQLGPEPTPPIDPNELPEALPTLKLELSDEARASLEAAPWSADDVLGAFIDENGTRYEQAELNYRGAFALQNLIQSGSRARNWKLKLSSEQPYLERREWNFNREPHLRQKLAYDLMKFAGVRVPSAQHVLLEVNGENFGLYLRYEDPDNKSWLKEMFGSAAGDLYKAATDVPEQTKYFADLTVLGGRDEDYLYHYDKKLNDEGAAETDFSRLRAFITGLNTTPEAELEAWFDQNFDVSKFINYLVVSNFISNWDSYPQRPKNYWLYESPVTGRFVFLPWDLDATFERVPNPLHPMGDQASVFHEFDEFEGNDPNTSEGSERPLVRRLMAIERHRTTYVARYTELLRGILSTEYIAARVQALIELMSSHASEDELRRVRDDAQGLLDFVKAKHESVTRELEGDSDAGAR